MLLYQLQKAYYLTARTLHIDPYEPFHQQYFEIRSKAVEKLRSDGPSPYPYKFHVSLSIPSFLEKFEGLKPEERLSAEETTLAGE